MIHEYILEMHNRNQNLFFISNRKKAIFLNI